MDSNPFGDIRSLNKIKVRLVDDIADRIGQWEAMYVSEVSREVPARGRMDYVAPMPDFRRADGPS